MKRRLGSVILLCITLTATAAVAAAQETSLRAPATPEAAVPRLIRVSGALTAAAKGGDLVTFSVYADESGGEPLWHETQNVVVDEGGRYTILLGATSADGLPAELFASGAAHWLAVHLERSGEADPSRVRLASVPYALRAVDADTLGGRPASAYVLAPSAPDATASGSTPAGSSVVAPITSPPSYLTKFGSIGDVVASAVYESGGAVGIGTVAPLDALHVRVNDSTGSMTGYAVQNLGSSAFSYSGMLFYDQAGALAQFQGFNNSTHEYRINNIASGGSVNFMIGGNSKLRVANNGDVQFQNGFATLHVANGTSFGLGRNALAAATGDYNTALGFLAANAGTSAGYNTDVGAYTQQALTTGTANTVLGYGARYNDSTGGTNIAIGYFAGSSAPDTFNNIHIGSSGAPGDTGVTRIGTSGTHTSFFATGIRGVTTGAADAVGVVIDSNGQFGTINSSRRYKEDIRDMGDASSGLMRLRPVTFRYTKAYADGSKPVDYGLIAEEVEAVYPDLVAHLADGEVETVQYHKINAMLLNEVQKQHRALEEQRAELAGQRSEIELLKARLAALETKPRSQQ